MLNGRNLLLTIWLVLLIFSGSQAQEGSVSISLEEAILEASVNNKSILISQTDEKIAEANYRQTNAVFLPQANVSYTAMTTNNPLNVFGFKLQQQSVTNNDFNPAVLNDPSTTQNYLTRADVQMPLLNVEAPVLAHNRRRAGGQHNQAANERRSRSEHSRQTVRRYHP